MNKRVTVRISKSTGVNFETLKMSSISGIYRSSSISNFGSTTKYFIVYNGIFGYQALETVKSDYKLLNSVMGIKELDI